jgi:hypothetical protein
MPRTGPYWMHYSRYRVRRFSGSRLWSVITEDGELIRQYPLFRYDRAVAFADKLNHEEMESAMKAKRRQAA